MHLTTFYALLAGATAALAAPAPSPQTGSYPQTPTICQAHPGGYFCARGINGPDWITQCNPSGGEWLWIGSCRTNEYCWADGKGQAWCRSR